MSARNIMDLSYERSHNRRNTHERGTDFKRNDAGNECLAVIRLRSYADNLSWSSFSHIIFQKQPPCREFQVFRTHTREIEMPRRLAAAFLFAVWVAKTVDRKGPLSARQIEQ